MRALFLAILLLVPSASWSQGIIPTMPQGTQYAWFGLEGQSTWAFTGTYVVTANCVPWNFSAHDESAGPTLNCTGTDPRARRVWPFDVALKRMCVVAAFSFTGVNGISLQLRKTVTTAADTDVGPELSYPTTNVAVAVGDIVCVDINETLTKGKELFLLARDGPNCQAGSGCDAAGGFGRHEVYIEYVPGAM